MQKDAQIHVVKRIMIMNFPFPFSFYHINRIRRSSKVEKKLILIYEKIGGLDYRS